LISYNSKEYRNGSLPKPLKSIVQCCSQAHEGHNCDEYVTISYFPKFINDVMGQIEASPEPRLPLFSESDLVTVFYLFFLCQLSNKPV
jgi:hypothetical protein